LLPSPRNLWAIVHKQSPHCTMYIPMGIKYQMILNFTSKVILSIRSSEFRSFLNFHESFLEFCFFFFFWSNSWAYIDYDYVVILSYSFNNQNSYHYCILLISFDFHLKNIIMPSDDRYEFWHLWFWFISNNLNSVWR
jgi:hypothetical protein